MLISVVVAVYNTETLIARCIESIIGQSYQNLEIILVDDGSTDGSGKICDAYQEKDARIKVVHRKNGGLSAARNTGIAHAAGDYIAFADGDDWIEADMYEKMAEQALEKNADLVACRYRQIYRDYQLDGSTNKITVYTEPYSMLIQYLREEEEFLIQHAAWNKLYRRDLLGEERFPEGRWYDDVVFSARILSKVQKGVYIDSALYNYVCQREGSIMNAGLTEKYFTDLLPSYIDKESFLKELPNSEPLCLHRYYWYKRLLVLYRDLFKKENKAVRRHKKEVVQLLRERKSTFPEVYGMDIAARTERIKMKIFMFSPFLFRVLMAVNDAWILPLRLKRMEKKKC